MNSHKSEHLLVENIKKLQDKIEKLQTYNSSLFIGQSYFFNDGAQPYLTFQPLYDTLKRLGDTEKVVSWKPKGFSAEKLTATPTTTDNSLSPSNKWYGDSNFCLLVKGSCFKQKKITTYATPNRINFYIVYELELGHEI